MLMKHNTEEGTTHKNKNKIPKAVNWHFWPWCNYGCKFCFAQFEDIPRHDRLPKHIALTIPELLADAGAEKITFVGGEPTLCPYLGELLSVSKDVGLTTCVVSNGTGLTEKFLDNWGSKIDWVGISIDASSDIHHLNIGRGLKSELSKGNSFHLDIALKAWNLCKSRGIRMKLNTVVCKQNLHDNMTDLVNYLQPERWKVFQVLPVEGQNDHEIDDMIITKSEFNQWTNRHADVKSSGIDVVFEDNELMRGSYAMLDALGRFYSNSEGGHQYGGSILEEGVLEAWLENCFYESKFFERGGEYEW